MSEGSGTYLGRNLADLDPESERTGYDMIYEPDASRVWRLSAAHAWGAVLPGPNMPTYEECEAARKVEQAFFVVDETVVGRALCLVTNGNRRAAIQITSAPNAEGHVGFHYVVWAED